MSRLFFDAPARVANSEAMLRGVFLGLRFTSCCASGAVHISPTARMDRDGTELTRSARADLVTRLRAGLEGFW